MAGVPSSGFLLILAIAMSANAAEKAQSWLEVRSPHFIVVANAGEKQARRVAEQFELIRAVFQRTFPKSRVDPPGPVTILAVRDERSLKLLLPGMWEQKGRFRPAGFFVRGPAKHYVALRVDVAGRAAYHTIYHEYVHVLISLNLPHLPTWLNEGVAEFYGHSAIQARRVELGRPSEAHIALLRRNKLLPLELLFTVDEASPYYNETDKAPIFYAQSWALTHYLMLGDQRQHNKQLAEFVTLIGDGINQQEAVKRAFGDLGDLERRLERYIAQMTMSYAQVEAPAEIDEQRFVARELTAAESAAVRGDFHLHNRRLAEARALLEEALRLDPNLGLAHEGMGFLYLQQGERQEAARWLDQAVNLNSQSYLAYYYHAMLAQYDPDDEGSAARVENDLRRAIELNPDFAPAYVALSAHYGNLDEELEEACALARKAVELEPGVVRHHLNLGSILLRMDRPDEAGKIGQRALAMSTAAEDRTAAQSFVESVRKYVEYTEESKRMEERARAARQELVAESRQQEAVASQEPPAPPASVKPSPEVAPAPAPGMRAVVDGRVMEVSCSPKGLMKLVLEVPAYELELHARNYRRVEFRATGEKLEEGFQPCRHLRGRKARVTYMLGDRHAGELVSVELRK